MFNCSKRTHRRRPMTDYGYFKVLIYGVLILTAGILFVTAFVFRYKAKQTTHNPTKYSEDLLANDKKATAFTRKADSLQMISLCLVLLITVIAIF